MDIAKDQPTRVKNPAEGDTARIAMILAAGRGERMRPLTDKCPKPLIEICGRPLIVWHLNALAKAGIRKVVVNLGWLGDDLRARLGDGERFGVSLQYSEEGFPPLETGGGIFNALSLLGCGPFVVVNSDVWTDFSPGTLRCPADSLAHLVMVANPAHNPAGDFCLEGSRISREGRGDRLTFSGIGIYRAELFDGCRPGRFSLVPLLCRAMSAGRVTGQRHSGAWIDVGDPDRLKEAGDLAARTREAT